MADLLFFTPVLPSPVGNGPAMRASVAVEVLAERYRVFVVHPDLWGWRHGVFREEWVRRTAARYYRVPTPIAPVAARDLLADGLAGANPEAAYVFRLAAAPFALEVIGLGNRPVESVLDLDDNECARGARFAEMHQARGAAGLAEQERRALPMLRTYERALLPRFSVSLLAGLADRDDFAARYPALRFGHLPNVVRLPAAVREAYLDPPVLLFLGTLDYFPNEDAILYFCDAILPLIRRSAHLSVRVVGTNAPASVRALGDLAGVTVAGAVPSVAPEFERCGIFIVPLRAGSGTRIKILEAFSYRRPVVSTSVGAEGLGVRHEEHLLIADTPEEFAAACLRLAADEQLRARLVENAHRWLLATHHLDRAREVLHSLYTPAG